MSARKIEVAHSRGCCTHTAVPAGAGGWDDRRLADQRPHDRRDRVAGRPHHILGRRRQAPAVRRTGVCGRRNRSRRRLSTPPTRWCGKSCRQSRYAASWVLSVCVGGVGAFTLTPQDPPTSPGTPPHLSDLPHPHILWSPEPVSRTVNQEEPRKRRRVRPARRRRRLR